MNNTKLELVSEVSEDLKLRKPVIIMVAASTKENGIGKENNLPWSIKEDLKFFREITCSTIEQSQDNKENTKIEKVNAIILGRKTWDSMKRIPLKNRKLIVLSRKLQKCDNKNGSDVSIVKSLDEAINLCNNDISIHKIVICGGESIYRECIEKNIVETIYLTRVSTSKKEFDTYFPDIPESFVPISMSQTFCCNDISYDFMIYENEILKLIKRNIRNTSCESEVIIAFENVLDKIFGERKISLRNKVPKDNIISYPSIIIRDHPEFQYLDMLSNVLQNGHYRGNRTGINTYSIFGASMRFDLRESFPLLTTKNVAMRIIFEELMWFIKGDTNGNHLLDKKVFIWAGNGSKEYLNKIGLGYREENDLGPIYGFQWRHFNAEYKTMHDNYNGQGVDQLSNLIESLKKNPYDRRHILSAWNPSAMKYMALPPCHILSQFYVDNNNRLSCSLYQRSCDLGLGCPFNIASYSLLCVMIAHICGYEPGEFIHFIGDAHIYENHVEQLKQQIKRLPRPFPQLRLKRKVDKVEDFIWEDIEIIGYYPHPTIKMEMAV
ncbi:thymidylate synthase family protein [Cryptosporidium andersoni]|uniref:Bifunctional dihydrofolate reductase-thymidylate synthase n=1 Tax=Cryptosporidium andersoni TaxID=117008 RepID=A0A1J4MPK9_9CRYT|nr:thymidylate synthase family protein [Cryptosporidium andersoni]